MNLITYQQPPPLPTSPPAPPAGDGGGKKKKLFATLTFINNARDILVKSLKFLILKE